MKRKLKIMAHVAIKNAAKMTPTRRKQVATWLRSRATLLEKHADLLAGRFTARYIC